MIKMRVCRNDACPAYDSRWPTIRQTWQGGPECPRCGQPAPEERVQPGKRDWATGKKEGVVIHDAEAEIARDAFLQAVRAEAELGPAREKP